MFFLFIFLFFTLIICYLKNDVYTIKNVYTKIEKDKPFSIEHYDVVGIIKT